MENPLDIFRQNMPGTILKYQYHDTFQQTRYSLVVDGTDMENGKKVALKISHINNLFDEYKILLMINHPNIIRPIDFFQYEGFNILVLPRANGLDLEKYITINGPLEEPILINVMRSLFSAVEYLHANGIWHCDIKPENIFCMVDSSNPQFVLGDFGLAKIVKSNTINDPSTICGTPSYMAPELHDDQEYSNKIDIWALGVVMCFCLCSRYPFPRHDGLDGYDLNLIRNANYMIYQDADNPISEDALDLISHLLKKTPTKRYSAKTALTHQWFHRKPLKEEIIEQANEIDRQISDEDEIQQY